MTTQKREKKVLFSYERDYVLRTSNTHTKKTVLFKITTLLLKLERSF